MRNLLAHCLPYRLKVRLQKARRFVDYEVGIRTGRLDPLLPPYWISSVGSGDYLQIGDEFLRYFVELGGLKPHEQVLDIGCGSGRMARPLTRYLQTGSYDGIDITATSIEWCQKTYSRRYPNFRFQFADTFNAFYNPTGKQRAAEYRFPFAAASFDFIFLTSVFTHLLPGDLENYLAEVTRMLKPNGHCLITYFLLNAESLALIGQHKSSFTFSHTLPGCRVDNPEVVEAAVAYDETVVRALYQRYGLHINEPIQHGNWCGRTNFLSYQDIIVATKPG